MFYLIRAVKTTTLILLSLFLAACTTLRPPELSSPFDGNYSPITEYLSAFIKREMKSGDLTGLSVALVDKDQMVWSEGFGFADKAKNIKATANTRYRAGSVSKLFNATAVMQLAEQGKLDIDAPVITYVPDFKINSRFGSTDDITLRSLLSHQSGMPSDIVDGMWSTEVVPLTSLLEVWKETHVVKPTNRFFNYSNTGVSLSGLAVQTVTGKAYETHIKASLLDALNMVNSDFTGRLEGENAAKGYIGKKLVAEPPLRDTPAGGLNTTVEDLSNFLIAVHNKGQFKGRRIIEASSLEEMFEVQNEGRLIDLGLQIGLGWFHASELLGGRYKLVGHDGRTVAHSAGLVTAPDAGLGVVILSNSADNSGVIRKISRQAMKLLYASRNEESIPRPSTPPVTDQLQSDLNLAGDYAGPFDLIQIKHDGKYFTGNAFGMIVSLRPEPNNWHSLRVKLAGLTLQPDDLKSIRVTRARIDDVERLIGTEDGEPFLLGDLIDPYAATPAWDTLLGEYHHLNPLEVAEFNLKKFHFKRNGNYYYVELTDNNDVTVKLPIKPLNDHQFIFLGTGRGLGETVSVMRKNDKTVIRYSGLKFEV